MKIGESKRLMRLVEITRQETARGLYDSVICPMCYRLNPQHATADHGVGCKSCAEKEVWCDD